MEQKNDPRSIDFIQDLTELILFTYQIINNNSFIFVTSINTRKASSTYYSHISFVNFTLHNKNN